MSADSKIQMTLRWEKFDDALSRGLQEMLFDKDLVDVTLACQGEYIEAHKNVLSVCSPYFKQLFKVNPCTHPIVILQEAKVSHVKSILSFIYTGETTIPQNELSAFLRTAETLRVRGLSDGEVDEAIEEQTKLQSYEEFTGLTAIKRKRMADQAVVETQDLQTLNWSLASTSTSTVNNLNTQYANLPPIKNENVEHMPLDWGIPGTEEEIIFIGETAHNSVQISNPSISLSHQQGSNVTSVVTMNPNLQPTSSTVTLTSSNAEMLSRILIMPQGEQREESINQLVQQVRTSPEGTMQHRYSLPCKTDSEIIHLNQLLETDKELLAIMSASLGLLGGKNPYQAVRRTFSEVIGHEVAGQYRWSGSQGGKKSITKLPNILKLITNASMLNPASRSLSITEVENILKVWLRSSGDREGGRNRRRRKDLANQQRQQQLRQQQQRQQATGNHAIQHQSQHQPTEHPTNQPHIQQSPPVQQMPQPDHMEQEPNETANTYSRPLVTYPRIPDGNRVVASNTNQMHSRPLLVQQRPPNNETLSNIAPPILPNNT